MRTLSEKLGLLQGVRENPDTVCGCTDATCNKCEIEACLKAVEALLDQAIADVDADQ